MGADDLDSGAVSGSGNGGRMSGLNPEYASPALLGTDSAPLALASEVGGA